MIDVMNGVVDYDLLSELIVSMQERGSLPKEIADDLGSVWIDHEDMFIIFKVDYKTIAVDIYYDEEFDTYRLSNDFQVYDLESGDYEWVNYNDLLDKVDEVISEELIESLDLGKREVESNVYIHTEHCWVLHDTRVFIHTDKGVELLYVSMKVVDYLGQEVIKEELEDDVWQYDWVPISHNLVVFEDDNKDVAFDTIGGIM